MSIKYKSSINNKSHTILAPKITVFMAAYNAADFISQAIESVLDQTFQDFEILIVNDGSTDNTLEIIQTFKDHRIRVINNSQNRGLSNTRNIALKEAKGEFLAILDSDDVALPNRLEIQIKHFYNRPKLAVLGSCAYVINNLGVRTGDDMIPICGTSKLHAALLFYNSFVHSTVMMRIKSFKEVGGYPSYPIAEDYGLFSKIALKYEVDNIPKYTIEYRFHDNNISSHKKELHDSIHRDILSFQLSHLLSSIRPIDLDILSKPVYGSSFTIEQYYTCYSNIIIENRKKRLYPCYELEHQLYKNWFTILMEKGKTDTLKNYFRRPVFSNKFVTAKDIRKVLKKTIKSALG